MDGLVDYVLQAPKLGENNMDNTCQAIQDGAMVTFDPFEMIETDGIEATMIGHLCGKPAHYMLRGKYNVEYKTCAAHLALLVDESAGDWDGGVVAVTKLDNGKGQ